MAMTTAEITSVFISFASLAISAYALYKSTLSKFQVSVKLKPYIHFTSINERPSLVVCYEIVNLGARPGMITSLRLRVSYNDPQNGDGSVDFSPLYSRESYNPEKVYGRDDFEIFDGFTIPKDSRLARYIVFQAGNFSPGNTIKEIKVIAKAISSEKKTNESTVYTFGIDLETINVWRGQTQKVVTVEAFENRTAYSNASKPEA